MTNRSWTRVVLALAWVGVVALGAGCAASGSRTAATPPEALLDRVSAHEVTMFDGRTGQRLSPWLVVGRARAADAVLFGELHGHPVGLPVAAAIWEDVLAGAGGGQRPALLLEFFERDQQLALDDYLADQIDEDAFMERAGRSDSNYPDAHRAMVEATRVAGGAVLAANAPRRYVRLARTEGYDALRGFTDAQRATFVLPPDEQGPADYRERFVRAMGGMGASHGGSGPLDFLRSQLVWDATMADSVARALRAGHEPVALVVGRFHVEFNGATRAFLERERPRAGVLSIVMVPSRSAMLADEDRGRGDVVVYVGPMDAGEQS